MLIIDKEKESVNVLKECIELQLKKSRDYQNPNSNVEQAMHYRRGVDTIHDIMHGKMLRAQSLLEAAANSTDTPNYESLEDTYKDLINYASFAVTYLRGKMQGQSPDRNMFNKPKPKNTGEVKADGFSYSHGNILYYYDHDGTLVSAAPSAMKTVLMENSK